MSKSAMEIWRTAYAAREVAERARDRLGEAEAILKLGVLFRTLPNPGIDSRLLMRAESIFRANGLSAKAESCRVALSHCLFHLGRESHAIAAANGALQESGLPIAHRIKGIVQTALSQGRLGRFDAALRVLRQNALPLSRVSDQPQLIAHVKWAIGVILMQILIKHQFPTLSTEPPGAIGTAEQNSAELVLSHFDQVDALMPLDEQLNSTAVGRQVVQGLFGDAGAVSALFKLSGASSTCDPLLAAWARCGAGTVLMSQNRLEHASAVFDEVMMLAKPLGAMSLMRDAMLQQSRIYEKSGEAQASLTSYRRYSEMLVESLVSPTHEQSTESRDVSAESTQNEPWQERNIEPLQVKRASKFIDENLSEVFDVADVVRHCGVSRRNLEIVFRQSKSVTLAQYIRTRRMDRAVELLHTTNWSVRAVALAVGYRSPTLFARAFRAQFGINPGVWRREGLVPSDASILPKP